MSNEVTEETYTTIAGTGDPEFSNALTQMAESQVAARAKRTRTFLTSELPVRTCTEDCPIRSRCKDYKLGRVEDNELCRPELRKIKKWQTAFRKGDLDQLKDDVGAVAGSLAAQVNRLLEAVNQDGVIIEVEKYSASGDRYKETVTHPALKEASNILKTLGIDLSQFLMTPKSQKDSGPQQHLHLTVTPEEVHARFAARFADTKPADDS